MLYRRGPLRSRAPARHLLGGDRRPRAGRPRAARRRPPARSRSSAAATPASPAPTTWPATASAPWCSRPARSAGVLRAATAASAASAGTKLGYGTMAERFGPRRPAAISTTQRPAWRWSATSPPPRASTSSPTGEGEHYVAHKPSRVAACTTKAELVERLFGERWPVWSREELAERLLDAPEAHACLVVPHYFGLHPLRYVRGLAAAAARRRGGRPSPHARAGLGAHGRRPPAPHADRHGHGRARRRRDQRLHAGGPRPGARRPHLARALLHPGHPPAHPRRAGGAPLDQARPPRRQPRPPVLHPPAARRPPPVRRPRRHRRLAGRLRGPRPLDAQAPRREASRLARRRHRPRLVGPGLPRPRPRPHLGWLDPGTRTLAALPTTAAASPSRPWLGRAAAAVLAGKDPTRPCRTSSAPRRRTSRCRACGCGRCGQRTSGYQLRDEWR